MARPPRPRQALAATTAAACLALGIPLLPSPASAQDVPPDWQVEQAEKRMRMSIQAEQLSTSVADFPVMVRLTRDTFDFASADPEQLVFLTPDGETPLPYQVETWDPAGNAVLWVRVPEVGPALTTVDLYYDGAPESSVSPAEVWDEEFVSVHHFEQAGGAIIDATGNGNDGEAFGGTEYAQPGLTGRSLAFDGVDDYVNLGDTAVGVAQMTASASVYIDPESLSRSWAVFAGRDHSGGQQPGEQFVLGLQGGSYLSRYIVDGQITTGPSAPASEGWHNVTTTFDGETMEVYVDGEHIGGIDAAGALDPGAVDLVLGAYGTHDLWMKFMFDEFRISDTARDAAWIRAEQLARTDQLVTALPTQSRDGSVVLAVHSPIEGRPVGGSVATLAGTVSAPAELSYRLDGGEPVSLGHVDAEFGVDLTDLATGEHTVEVIARVDETNSDTRTITFPVDAAAPEVTFHSPTQSGVYVEESFVVDVTAADPYEVTSLDLLLDGEPVANGDELTPDDLPDGQHTLTATAVDGLGNSGEERITFTTAGSYPDEPADPAPADGAVQQDPEGTTLGVTVADPAGDLLDVAVKWAYRGDFADGAVAATQGSSTAATPGRVAGDTVTDTAPLAAADGVGLTTDADAAYPFQQFEIEVPADLGTSEYTVNWSGEVPASQRAAMSVWNYDTQSWQLLAEGDGGEELTLSGRARVDDTVRSGVARLMVQDVAATVVSDQDASFLWLTDTQFYSEREPETFQKMVDWGLDNREAENLGYGIHTGDIVNRPTVAQEWTNASGIMETWDEAGFPYGVVPGNHDIANGHYEVYRTHFGEARYADAPWYGGTADDNVQHYDVVSTAAADYLIVYIDWSLSQEEIDWANQVIADHPEHNVVIATHQYIDPAGEYYGPGQDIFEQVVLPNENVDLILCGHLHSTAYNVKHLDDRVVVEILHDTQSLPTAGGGWMRIVDFDSEAQTVSNRTLSVLTDGDSAFGDPDEENFTVPLDIEAPTRWVETDYVGITARSHQVIGDATEVPSGGRVTVDAGELAADTTYRWYAEATDSDGFRTTGPVWKFTTGEGATGRTEAEVSGRDATRKVGQKVKVHATVAPRHATGTVTVTGADGAVECTAPVRGSRARCDLAAALEPGQYQLALSYSGDETYAPASGTVTVTVVPRGLR